MVIALELGLLYAIMAIGVYLTYRVLDFPDLTVDGSFTTGAAIAALLIINGAPAWLASLAGLVGGLVAGAITGLLHVWGGINPLLSGILTQVALYSINLRIMGKANLSLLQQPTVFQQFKDTVLGGWFGVTDRSVVPWGFVVLLLILVVVMGALAYWFLGTRFGVALRATGDNQLMARSQGINTGTTKIAGLAISNGLVGLCGALVAQFQGYADISMGTGLIVAGLASVIIGQALLGMTAVWQAILAACVGSVLYRGIIQLALEANLDPNDMKLISAIIVILALVLPKWGVFTRLRRRQGVAVKG